MKLSGNDFINDLVQTFPDLKEEIEEWNGLLHVQMGVFARITQEAVEYGDISKIDQCFALAHRMFHDADPELKNALYVSYLENLDFNSPNGQLARTRMSNLLKAGYKEINDYLDKLFEKGLQVSDKTKKR